MLLANCLFFGGAIATVIGVINIINFSKSSIAKIIICAVLIIGGASCCLVGNAQRQNRKTVYEVNKIIELSKSSYQVTLKAENGTEFFVCIKPEYINEFTVGGTVEFTSKELDVRKAD